MLGVIADDFTGALETAAMLIAGGVDCAFLTTPDLVGEVGDADAVVVAHRFRVAPASEARARALATADRLLGLGVERLFFKYCATFDSTDDGNIGPVADALLARLGARGTLYCPSFPEVGRTVYQGHLFLDRQLVSDSPKKDDPLTPMTDPDLVRVLGRQTPRPVGHLARRHIAAGVVAAGAEAECLFAGGTVHLIADAIEPADLRTLAELTADWPLVTGNSSIAAYFPEAWAWRGRWRRRSEPPALPAIDGPAVVLAGSCAERTLDQLAAFERWRPVLRIDIERVTDVAATVATARAWAAERLGDGPVAIATSATPDAVARSQAKHGRAGASRLAEDILSGLAAALAEDGARRFLIAGGETSGAIVERLGIRRLEVGAFTAPGIGRAVSRGATPLALCLKSGKLGAIDMFLNTLDEMSRPGATR